MPSDSAVVHSPHQRSFSLHTSRPAHNRSDSDIREIKRGLTTARPSAAAASAKALPSAMSPATMSVLCYCAASIFMTVINKFVVSGTKFNMNLLLLSIQSFVCSIAVLACQRAQILQLRPFSMQDVKIWWPISALLVGVIWSGSKSLQYLAIPIYTIFKNLTIILIAYGEVIWFGGKVTPLTLVSFLLMVFSSVIAAVTDPKSASAASSKSFDATLNSLTSGGALEMVKSAMSTVDLGYSWMAVNCVVSAAYVLAMRKRIKVTGFSDWDSMFYNNLLSIPIMLSLSFMVEDWSVANLSANFPADTRLVLLTSIAVSGAAAVGISYTTAWCVRVTSSTTYSMVGALNKLPVAASGMMFFGDPVTAGSVSAISAGFLAGIVYAAAKNLQKKQDTPNVMFPPSSANTSASNGSLNTMSSTSGRAVSPLATHSFTVNGSGKPADTMPYSMKDLKPNGRLA